MVSWGAKRKRSGGGGSGRGASWKRSRRAGVYKRWARRGAAGSRTGSMRIRRTTKFVRTANAAESQYDSVYISAGVNYTNWNLMFNLSDLDGVTDLTAMFDEYRINRLTYRFFPRFSALDAVDAAQTVAVGVTTQPSIPDFIYAIDDDGRFAAGTVDALLQYGNVKVSRGNRVVTVSFVPSAFTSLQTNPVGTTAAMGKFKKKWIACSSSSIGVDFYGLALGLKLPGTQVGFNSTAPGAPAAYSWDVYVTADISLRKTL